MTKPGGGGGAAGGHADLLALADKKIRAFAARAAERAGRPMSADQTVLSARSMKSSIGADLKQLVARVSSWLQDPTHVNLAQYWADSLLWSSSATLLLSVATTTSGSVADAPDLSSSGSGSGGDKHRDQAMTVIETFAHRSRIAVEQGIAGRESTLAELEMTVRCYISQLLLLLLRLPAPADGAVAPSGGGGPFAGDEMGTGSDCRSSPPQSPRKLRPFGIAAAAVVTLSSTTSQPGAAPLAPHPPPSAGPSAPPKSIPLKDSTNQKGAAVADLQIARVVCKPNGVTPRQRQERIASSAHHLHHDRGEGEDADRGSAGRQQRGAPTANRSRPPSSSRLLSTFLLSTAPIDAADPTSAVISTSPPVEMAVDGAEVIPIDALRKTVPSITAVRGRSRDAASAPPLSVLRHPVTAQLFTSDREGADVAERDVVAKAAPGVACSPGSGGGDAAVGSHRDDQHAAPLPIPHAASSQQQASARRHPTAVGPTPAPPLVVLQQSDDWCRARQPPVRGGGPSAFRPQGGHSASRSGWMLQSGDVVASSRTVSQLVTSTDNMHTPRRASAHGDGRRPASSGGTPRHRIIQDHDRDAHVNGRCWGPHSDRAWIDS